MAVANPKTNRKTVRRKASGLSPQEMKAHLDTIVVGQERAKKILAVATVEWNSQFPVKMSR